MPSLRKSKQKKKKRKSTKGMFKSKKCGRNLFKMIKKTIRLR